MTQDNLDQLCVTALRMLAVDAIDQAKSGHPGMPLGAAPMAYALWKRVMRHNPRNAEWFNRDRFILSAGHGSALLYGLLHLSGYDMSLDDLRAFRQWESQTPGHPEYGHTPGVEATTGPLGQGFGMGVGMALAERRLAETFNHPDFLSLVNHFTYAIVSDGDLMEGISAEAASLAGHLCLGKLIYLYDDNRISIEGSTDITFSENVAQRFEAYEWQVLRVSDGEDLDAIEQAILQAQADEERPSLIIVSTHIGYGTPVVDTPGIHGTPLNEENMSSTRRFFEWPEERFHVPDAVREHMRALPQKGDEAEGEWTARLEAFRSRFPDEAEKFLAQIQGELPKGWSTGLDALNYGDAPVATRSASGMALNALAPDLPSLIGGSADLGPSNNTTLKAFPDRNIHFGVREHAMGAMINGMALHGGVVPYCGTFLVFSDYMRGAIRLSALMGLPVTYVLTHDSIAVGEDGPTHQPIEHVVSLRAIPDLQVIRPADGWETAAAWRLALKSKKPTALILSRQKLPTLDAAAASQLSRGAYILAGGEHAHPDLILIGSGSEVHLALSARDELERSGVKTRVVSMPSWELFETQPATYQDAVLPPDCRARISMEAGSSLGWRRWVGEMGRIISVDQFGASAPGGHMMEAYGFSTANVVRIARDLLGELMPQRESETADATSQVSTPPLPKRLQPKRKKGKKRGKKKKKK
ncbi:MAG: transketolase [Magnetococcales bacterium]|nr:transketolase [Magnetococcales bacterium]